MDRLIDEKTAETLKIRFAEILTRDLDIKIYTDHASEYAQFTVEFLKELSEISGRIRYQVVPSADGKAAGYSTDPTIIIGENLGVKMVFNGTPAGHEANSILETVILAGTSETAFSDQELELIRLLDKPVQIRVFVTTTCPYCPQMAVLAFRLAMANPQFISAEVVEAQENQTLATQFEVTSVPMQTINADPASKTAGVQRPAQFINQVLSYGYSGYAGLVEKQDAEKARQYELKDAPDGTVTLADVNLDSALKKYPKLVVDCWADWCNPCKMMGPVIDELARDYSGRIVYGKLNVDENPQASARFKVESIPCFLLFQDGVLVDTLTGARPRAELESEINAKLKTLII